MKMQLQIRYNNNEVSFGQVSCKAPVSSYAEKGLTTYDCRRLSMSSKRTLVERERVWYEGSASATDEMQRRYEAEQATARAWWLCVCVVAISLARLDRMGVCS